MTEYWSGAEAGSMKLGLKIAKGLGTSNNPSRHSHSGWPSRQLASGHVLQLGLSQLRFRFMKLTGQLALIPPVVLTIKLTGSDSVPLDLTVKLSVPLRLTDTTLGSAVMLLTTPQASVDVKHSGGIKSKTSLKLKVSS